MRSNKIILLIAAGLLITDMAIGAAAGPRERSPSEEEDELNLALAMSASTDPAPKTASAGSRAGAGAGGARAAAAGAGLETRERSPSEEADELNLALAMSASIPSTPTTASADSGGASGRASSSHAVETLEAKIARIAAIPAGEGLTLILGADPYEPFAQASGAVDNPNIYFLGMHPYRNGRSVDESRFFEVNLDNAAQMAQLALGLKGRFKTITFDIAVWDKLKTPPVTVLYSLLKSGGTLYLPETGAMTLDHLKTPEERAKLAQERMDIRRNNAIKLFEHHKFTITTILPTSMEDPVVKAISERAVENYAGTISPEKFLAVVATKR